MSDTVSKPNNSATSADSSNQSTQSPSSSSKQSTQSLKDQLALQLAAYDAAQRFDVKHQSAMVTLGILSGLNACPHCKKNVVLSSKCTAPGYTSYYHLDLCRDS
jgi:hypothetical protein